MKGKHRMKIGYARVSTKDQNSDLQVDALKKAGCEKIYVDHGISGAKMDRPELTKALNDLRRDDILIVWKMDRLGRNLKRFLELMEDLDKRGVQFESLTEKIDTTTPIGRLYFQLTAALAEFERSLTAERRNEGLKAARERGRMGGRPPRLNEKQIRLLNSMAKDTNNKVSDIRRALGGISRATYYRHLERNNNKEA